MGLPRKGCRELPTTYRKLLQATLLRIVMLAKRRVQRTIQKGLRDRHPSSKQGRFVTEPVRRNSMDPRQSRPDPLTSSGNGSSRQDLRDAKFGSTVRVLLANHSRLPRQHRISILTCSGSNDQRRELIGPSDTKPETTTFERSAIVGSRLHQSIRVQSNLRPPNEACSPLSSKPRTNPDRTTAQKCPLPLRYPDRHRRHRLHTLRLKPQVRSRPLVAMRSYLICSHCPRRALRSRRFNRRGLLAHSCSRRMGVSSSF